MVANLKAEDKDLKRDSAMEKTSEESERLPDYAVQAPRQEPPPDLSRRLASLNLNALEGVINITGG